MPSESYAALTGQDVADLVAYSALAAASDNQMPGPMPAGGDGPAPFFRMVLPAGAPAN